MMIGFIRVLVKLIVIEMSCVRIFNVFYDILDRMFFVVIVL